MQAISELRASMPKDTKRFIKFLIVGMSSFLVDFGLFNFFHAQGVGTWVAQNLFSSFWSSAAAFLAERPEVVEQSLSFSIAVVNSFFWNYFWIYPEAKNEPIGKKLTQFVIVSVAGLLLGVPIFSGALMVTRPVVATVGLQQLRFNVAGNLALMVRVGVILFWNFYANRKWTYGHVE
ncbi:MAG: GtrA family protein [Chloroflexi bacterium]|nr:GtrA family protein [Chloroflexota bacterium]MBI5715405.1 GtrA family protein [Chloroflexota bacterium]